MFITGNIIGDIIILAILIYSAILHEISHGLIADRLGDPTARLAGRLSLNPLKHIDPYMSLLVPFFLIYFHSPVIFGAAKPVPVDPFNLRDGFKDTAIVSLAGPLTNIIIAIIGSILIHLFYPRLDLIQLANTDLIGFILYTVVQINILLAIFNLIPIPPLDGSKVFALLLPEREAAIYLSLSSVGFIIIFFLLLFPIGGFSLGGLIFNLMTFSQKILGL